MKETKEIKRAVALSYLSEADNAPRVVARGTGKIADRILELAAQSDVPVRQQKVLAETLSLLEPGEEIPEDLYLAVAEILAQIISIDRGETNGDR
ncbi:MAG: EscU/YscU/HrcU family type III secretion system export apparatus switch protein [Bacillota bacterium]|nr:EscU/YscU/HrcU family type III secretion system export apparatus switch protein [Bacillota bacterium]MDW7683954.1 EscU/YscU/HrcU family type III secretion system export apparatus switch protein [Bacillota bacterium]